MSDGITLELLSLTDLFGIGEIRVYHYGNDVVLTAVECDVERLIHLYENEVDDRVMYGINRGRVIQLKESPSFSGQPASIEISYFKGDTDWDFQSLVLTGSEGMLLRICRNNASFPEPTFITAS